MPIEATTDECGDVMKLLLTQDGRIGATVFLEESIITSKSLPLRADDILLCSYTKAGCHWTWEILRCLVFNNTFEEAPIHKESQMFELNTHDQLNALPSPRILNNHFTFDQQPADIFSKLPKIVYVYRNVKDLAVSLYYHTTELRVYEYSAPFSNFLKRFQAGQIEAGSVFDYMNNWDQGIQAHPELNVHVISYENLKDNPMNEIKRLSKFLGKNSDEDFLSRVVEFTNIKAMRTRKGLEKHLSNKEGRHVMYRKGVVGDWKNHFTVADNETMDSLIQTHLAGLKLHTFRYQLP